MTKKLQITKSTVADAIKQAIPDASVSVTVHIIGQRRHSSIHPSYAISVHPRRDGQDGQAVMDAVKAFVTQADKKTTGAGKVYDCDISVHIRNTQAAPPVISSHVTF